MTLLEEVVTKYELATGTKIDPKKINLLSEASYTAKRALETIEFEPTGCLGVMMIRKAWGEFLNEAHFKVQDMLSRDFDDSLREVREFDNYMSEGAPGELLSSTISQMKKVAEKFDLDVSEVFKDYNKFIDIFEEGFRNIYKEYRVDKFRCNDVREGEPFVGTHEYHFHCLQDFVNCLKHSENCLIYAKVDGLYDYDDCDEYDTFFAFGCRCGEYVYINSTRPYHANPSSRKIKKSRNPGKKLYQTAANTWMPFYDLKKGTTVSTDTALMVIDRNILPTIKISEQYDNEAKLIIVISLYALYQKYYVQNITDIRYSSINSCKQPVEESWFGNEIKLLEGPKCTSLALPNELHLPSVTYSEYSAGRQDVDGTFCKFWDYYIDEYIKPDDILTPVHMEHFLGNKQEAERHVWWAYREQARTICNERRTKDIASMFYDEKAFRESGKLVDLEIDLRRTTESYNYDTKQYEVIPTGYSWADLHDSWGAEKLNNAIPSVCLMKNFDAISALSANLGKVYELVLTGGDDWGSTDWGGKTSHYYKGQKVERTRDAVFDGSAQYYNNIDNPDWDFDTASKTIHTRIASIQESNHINTCLDRGGLRYGGWDKETVYNKEFNSTIYFNRLSDDIWVMPNDYKNKVYYFEVQMRTIFDLCRWFGVKRDEFPKAMRRWTTQSVSRKPYGGNDILNVTDPMSNIYDLLDNQFRCNLHILLSEREARSLAKKLNIELNINQKMSLDD